MINRDLQIDTRTIDRGLRTDTRMINMQTDTRVFNRVLRMFNWDVRPVSQSWQDLRTVSWREQLAEASEKSTGTGEHHLRLYLNDWNLLMA